MIATRAFRLGAVLTLALAASLGMSNLAKGQATKTETKAKVAKEKAKAKAAELIDLNSATSAELRELPGVGEVTARKIIDGRPYKTVGDLSGAGVSASEIEKLKPLVEVTALPSPVDVNTDSLEKLETLPGVGPALAKEIVATRPHAGYDSIGKVKGIGEAKLDGLKGRLKFGEEPTVAKAKAKAKEEIPAAKAEEPKAKAKAKVAEAKKEAMPKVAEKAKAKDAPVSKLAPGTKININTATKEELDELFGIGEVKSQAILDYRKENGKFEKIEDIMKVSGIKEGIFAKIKDNITVK
jgi:competence protein ComEA